MLLCEEADFKLLLYAIAAELMYYDPGIKLVHKTEQKKKSTKRRNQFRVKFSDLKQLYKRTELVGIRVHCAQ